MMQDLRGQLGTPSLQRLLQRRECLSDEAKKALRLANEQAESVVEQQLLPSLGLSSTTDTLESWSVACTSAAAR